MGRTLPTFNTYLQAEMDAWRPMRRALRREQQAAFDHLFTRARAHTAEATAAARPVPFDSLVMAILLDLELEIQELRREVRELKGGKEGADGAAARENDKLLREEVLEEDGEGCGQLLLVERID